MALISLRQLLDHAAEHSYGVPAFNVNNLEQIRAIMEAADEANSPVILQASAGATKIRRIEFSETPYSGSDRRISTYTYCYASGSWCLAGNMSAFHTTRFFFGDDGWIA